MLATFLFSYCILTVLHAAGTPGTDRLINLFNNISNLPTWFNTNISDPLNNACNWPTPNIICSTNKITNIKLANHNLSGTLNWDQSLPPVITEFDVSNNNISGFYNFSSFPALYITWIRFSDNKFEGATDTDPSWIGARGSVVFDQLRGIFLANNKLGGTIGMNAVEFPQLRQLDLSDNNNIQSMPDFSSLPTTLLLLAGSGTNWDNYGDFDVSSLQSLRYLNVSNNKFSGTINFALFPNTILSIDVSGNNFIGTLQLTPDVFIAPDIEFVDVSNNSLSDFNISQWTQSFPQLREVNVLNNPLYNAFEYLPISDIPSNDRNITFLIDVAFACDPQMYCPAVWNGSNTSYVACDRSQNVCYGQQHCITTCVCCDAQIPTTTHVITTQFVTTSTAGEINNIISDLSDAIMMYLLHEHTNNRQNIDDLVHALYANAALQRNDLRMNGEFIFIKEKLMQVYIVKCNVNDMDKCNDIFLDIKWPKNGIADDLYYTNGDAYVMMDNDNDLVTVIIGEYIAADQPSNLNLISILKSDDTITNSGYTELKLILAANKRVLFDINLNNINWDEISNPNLIKIPLCLSRHTFVNTAWNSAGCSVHNYDSNVLICSCSHLTFFKASSDEFEPEINILTVYHFKQITFVNIFKYPTGICCIFVLLIIYLVLIKLLPELDNKPLLAIPDIVWRNKKSEVRETNGYTQIIRLTQNKELSVWHKMYSITMISVRDSHSLIRMFKHTKHTNTSTLQCVTCLFLYIACVLASGALFYGQGKTTISGAISLSFYCGFTACIPSYFVIFLFLWSRPRERKPEFTQKIFNKIVTNTNKNTKENENELEGEGALENIGQQFLSICQKLRESKRNLLDENENENETKNEEMSEGNHADETTVMAIIKDINISEIDAKSLDNLIAVTSSILQSEKIRKALLKKQYPFPNWCKIVAWVVTVLIVFICCILLIVYAINFDLVSDANYNMSGVGQSTVLNNTYMCADIRNENFEYDNMCSNSTVALMRDYMYANDNGNQYTNWGEDINNTSAFFWSTLLGLFLGWILYQPLSILLIASLRYIIIPQLTMENICKKCKCCKRINNEYENVNKIIVIAELELQNIKQTQKEMDEMDDDEILKDMGVIKTYDNINQNDDNEQQIIKTTFLNFIINDDEYTVDTNLVLKHINRTFSSLPDVDVDVNIVDNKNSKSQYQE